MHNTTVNLCGNERENTNTVSLIFLSNYNSSIKDYVSDDPLIFSVTCHHLSGISEACVLYMHGIILFLTPSSPLILLWSFKAVLLSILHVFSALGQNCSENIYGNFLSNHHYSKLRKGHQYHKSIWCQVVLEVNCYFCETDIYTLLQSH